MTLDQLEMFELVAQLGSLSQAAKVSEVAQPLISRKLAQIESEWGDRLFHRTGRGVSLTDFGRRIRPQVQSLLIQARRLNEEVKNAAGVPTGTVCIGILPSLSREFVNSIFSDIRAVAPAVRLQIMEGLSGQLDELLVSGRLDLAILNRYRKDVNPSEDVLGQVESFVVGKPDSPLLRNHAISFRDLKDVPLVLPAAPNGLRAVLEQNASKNGFNLNVVLEVGSLSTMRTIATNGDAFTISPFLAVDKEVAAGTLKAVKLVNPSIARIITLSISKHHPISLAARLVVQRVRKLIPALIEEGIAKAEKHVSPQGIGQQ